MRRARYASIFLFAIFCQSWSDHLLAIPDAVISTLDDPLNTVGQFSAIAVGPDGRPAISYYDATARDLRVLRCADSQCSSAAISQLDTGATQVGEYTSIAVPADNFPVVSYFDNTNKSLKVLKCNDSNCLGSDESIITVDDQTVNQVGLDTAIAIGADGLPIISYADLTAGTLKVAKCGNPSCTAGNIISTVAGSTADRIGEFSAIAVGSDGLPVISFFATTATDLRVAKCNDAACSGANETITPLDVDPAGSVGLDTAIIVPTDGLPTISYYDQTRRVLKVAKCSNSSCTSANLTTLDSVVGEDRGKFSAIGIYPTSGFPVISYFDATNSALRVVFCGNANCTATTLGSALDDPSNSVGSYTSLAIGTNGQPAISYFDTTAGALKFMTFSNNLFANGFE
jgi:hypothetical protein